MLGMMPMAMSQMPTLGNPQAQAQQQEMSLAQVLQMYQQAQSQMERAQAMQSPEYIQNSGGLGALAMAVQAYMGKRGENKAEGKVSELAEKAFRMQREEDAARQMAEYQRELAKEERKFGRDKELMKMRAELPGPAQLASIAVPGGTQQVIFDQKRRTMTDLGGNPLESMMAMAGQHGGQITSTIRSPEKNAKVGGVANSQHLSGTAMDAVFKDPQAKAAYMQAAQGNGFEVIDEGDHLHTELPPGYAARPGFKPDKPDVSAVQQRRKDLREMQASGIALTRGEAEHYMKTGEMPKAKEPSAAAMKREDAARARNSALGMFEEGMGEIERQMADTSTGPLMGLIPAVTADQQEADGAVAAMAPVLKQLFRSAGEGVFTDRDQALLIQMMPTRKDHPQARASKMENIRRMVRAKLSEGETIPPAQSGGWSIQRVD